MHKLKRGLVALLILVMVLSMLPVTALANADTAPSAEPEATTEVAAVPAEDSQDEEGEAAAQSETAVSDLPNLQSMMPLEEKYLPDLDLTGYLPGELWEFPVAKLVQLLGLPETPAVYSARYFRPIDGGWNSLGPDAFEMTTSDGTIDLYGDGTRDTMTLVLICGTVDQLDMNNTRYIVKVKMTPVVELVNVELYTLDHQKAQLGKSSGTTWHYNGTGKVSHWGIDLHANLNDPMWDYLKTDYRYYISLSLNKCLGDDVVVKAVNSYGDDIGDTDITAMLFDQSATGGYLLKEEKNSAPDAIYINFGRTNQESSSWLPYRISLDDNRMAIHTQGLYADGEDSAYRNYIVSESNYNGDNLTCMLQPGYAANGQYYLGLQMSNYYGNDTSRLGIDSVRKAVVGNYASEAAIPANATDIKAQLFADASEPGENNGFKANYSKGVTFTVIDTNGDVHHLTVKTVAYDASQIKPSSNTWLYVDGARQEEKVGENYPTYASYRLDSDNDSYYDNGYQTVFLLKSGENNTYGPVTDQNIRPVFYANENVKVHASVGGAGAELQTSGSTLLPFTSGEPVQYTATAANGKTTQNYWVTFLTQQSGPKLFVNAANDTTHYAEVDGQKMPQRELYLTDKYSNHDVFFANVGDANITGLYVRLENAENVALDDYWTVGKTTTLSAFTTTAKTTINGELANTAKIRLVPAVDENTGEMLSGAISGTLVIGYTGGGTEPVEEVRINLTGTAGDPRIITDGSKLHNGVKYVPYSVLIQTNSMGSNDNMVFSVVSGKLPDGLSLKANGEIYGVPTKPGTYTFTIKGVYGGNESNASTMDGTITIEKNTDENVLAVNDTEYGHKLLNAAPDEINMKNVVTRGGLAYLVVSGKEGGVTGEVYKWEIPISLRSEGPLDECVKVFIDGKLLTEGVDYDTEAGSTRVSIRTAALKNLSNGTHTIAVEFRENGDADGDMKTTSQNITINGSKGGSTSGGKDSGKTSIDNGDGTYITTVTEVVTVGKLSSEDKALLDALLNGRGVAGVYMNISAVEMERSTGKILRYLTETPSPLKVTVDIPQELLDAQKDGKFIYIVRIHDGKAEFLDTTTHNGKATFSSDKFSTYALVAMDERVAGVKTGDAGVTAYVLVAFVAVAAGAGVMVAQKRRSKRA